MVRLDDRKEFPSDWDSFVVFVLFFREGSGFQHVEPRTDSSGDPSAVLSVIG